jgi:hypothetical protein
VDGGVLFHGVEDDHGGGPAADLDEGEGLWSAHRLTSGAKEGAEKEKRITEDTE